MRITFLITIILLCVFPSIAQIVLHSHNDYEQARPIYTAIEQGFTSLELDIILDGNRLVVSHDDKDLSQKEELEFYLKRIFETYQNKASLWLLIDIKDYRPKVLQQLHQLIDTYSPLFHTRKGNNEDDLITIILSGDIPRREIIEDQKWIYFFIDGRPEHLGQNFSSQFMPLISTDFTKYSSWKGMGDFREKERRKIKELIRRVQSENKELRFWKTKDKQVVWEQLLHLGIRVIGTDQVKELAAFIKDRNRKN